MRERALLRGWLHHRAEPGERLAPAAGAYVEIMDREVNHQAR